MCPGISRDDAEHALANGWNREKLLYIHEKSEDWGFDCKYIAPFAFMVEDCFLAYKSATIRDLNASFEFRQEPERLIVAYADGSGTTALTPAGIGAYIIDPFIGNRLLSQNIGLGSNNAAELAAIWLALRSVPDIHQAIKIYSDSQYAIGALTQNWARNKNEALITNMRQDLGCRGEYVEFEHVDGHSGHAGNEVVDGLAKLGRKWITEISVYEGID